MTICESDSFLNSSFKTQDMADGAMEFLAQAQIESTMSGDTESNNETKPGMADSMDV